MLRTILPVGLGFVIGGIAVYGIYKYFSSKNPENEKQKKEAEYESKAKIAEERVKRLHELLDNKVHIENLSAKDLSAWFKEFKSEFENAKMIIATPTDEVMKGLNYPTTEPLDESKNLLQWFYDDESGKVLKIRLVNFSNIESNFQVQLLENNGMLVITD